MSDKCTLYSYYLSSCSWRVRAALRYKGIPYEEIPIDIIVEKQQLTDEYRAINPSQKVPTLIIDGETLVESMAILQYLEDTHPEPSLTPKNPLEKARMREICETIVSGIQPLQNVGVRPYLDSDEQYKRFTRSVAERGLQTLEALLLKSAGRYSVGDQITLADICLVPQLYNATTRLELELTNYPTISRLFKTLLAEKLFDESHPLKNKK